MSAFPATFLLVPALVFWGVSASVVAAEKPEQDLRTDSAPGLPLDRQAGEVHFGDGTHGRRPSDRQTGNVRSGAGASGQLPASEANLKRQPASRLKKAPIQKLPNNVLIQDDNRYENDKNVLRKKRKRDMQHQRDESADDSAIDDAKEQKKTGQRIIREFQQRQTESTRKTTRPH